MVTRQRPRVGAPHAGKIVSVYVEDTRFRVISDGREEPGNRASHTCRDWTAYIAERVSSPAPGKTARPE